MYMFHFIVTYSAFAIPVTIIMCVGRRMIGIGSGSSPWAARAVNDNAHSLWCTPKWFKITPIPGKINTSNV